MSLVVSVCLSALDDLKQMGMTLGIFNTKKAPIMPSTRCFKMSLPMPPSVNSIWKRGRNGQFLSEEAVAWYEEAIPITNLEKNRQRMQNLQGKVVVEYSLYYKDNRKQDADNRFKCLGDLLQKCGVVENDSQLLPRCIDFQVRPSNPGVDLRVYEKS